MKNNLRKHYETLTARERLVLLFAATERGDRAEVAALSTSAPHVRVAVADYFWIGEAFSQTHNRYLLEAMELAVSFGLSLGGDFSRKKELRAMVRLMAYNLVVRTDSWREFCHDLGMDPRWELLNPAGSAETLENAQRLARALAFSENEARAMVRKECGSAADHMWTVSSYTEVWHNLFNELVRKYEPVASVQRSSHRRTGAPRRGRR